MEMLAASKMNLRRIFAAGLQEGESEVGERGDGSRLRVGTQKRSPLLNAFPLLQQLLVGVDVMEK